MPPSGQPSPRPERTVTVGQLRGKRNLTRMPQYSVELYGRLEQETGQATDWKPVGSPRLASSEERWRETRATATTARSFGFELHLVSAEEAQKLFPLIDTVGVVGAAYIPSDGHIDPSGLTQSLAKGARAGGRDARSPSGSPKAIRAWTSGSSTSGASARITPARATCTRARSKATAATTRSTGRARRCVPAAAPGARRSTARSKSKTGSSAPSSAGNGPTGSPPPTSRPRTGRHSNAPTGSSRSRPNTARCASGSRSST